MESIKIEDVEMNKYIDVLMGVHKAHEQAREYGIKCDTDHDDMADETKEITAKVEEIKIKRGRGRPRKDKPIKEKKPNGRPRKMYIDPVLLSKEDKKRQQTALRNRAYRLRKETKSKNEYDTDESIEI